MDNRKKSKKSIVLKKVIVFFLLICALFVQSAKVQAQGATLVDPANKYQTIDGWGGSLCWWANIIGGWDDTKILMVCDWITDPKGLNMNIFRFNIGGGDDPTHAHMRADGGNMPGYKASMDAPYDWKQDLNQRKIALQLVKSRIAKAGVNDIVFEAFSNSPPWWMTVSGCAAGSVEGNVTNLKSDMFDDFADYLIQVTKYYHDSVGITFSTIDPFNEPFSNWWKANGGQEGCYFSQAAQETMIRELYSKLQANNMLSYTGITAMDANSLDETYNGVVGYREKKDILPKLVKINGHSYFASSTARKNLALFSKNNGDIKLWQSESGPLGGMTAKTDDQIVIEMALRIITDIKEMKCEAWIDWQIAGDGSPVWGLLVGKYSDPSNPISKAFSYHVRSQFSRFIKPGYSIIDYDRGDVLPALSPDNKELVLVVVNYSNKDSVANFDLSAFQTVGTSIQRYRSRQVNPSLYENCTKIPVTITGKSLTYTSPAYSVTTFVIPVTLSAKPVLNGSFYIKNKAAGKYIGIENNSAAAGGSLVLTSTQSPSYFDITADDLKGGFIVKPRHSGVPANFVLDVEGVSDNERAKIMQYADWGGKNQRFHFVYLENDYYKVIVRKSGKCWSVPDNIYTAGTPVLQMSWDGLDNSIWEISSTITNISQQLNLSPIKLNYNDGLLNISTHNSELISNVSVFDLTGRMVNCENYSASNEVSMNFDNTSGIYLVRTIVNNKVFTNKFINN